MCRIEDVCCLPAPAHQPFLFNSLGLSAPEEACSRNVRASGTLKFGYEGIFKIPTRSLSNSATVAFLLYPSITTWCYSCVVSQTRGHCWWGLDDSFHIFIHRKRLQK